MGGKKDGGSTGLDGDLLDDVVDQAENLLLLPHRQLTHCL
jgi:hypothetical protein